MSSVNSVFLLLGSVIAAGFVLRKSGAVGENDYKIYFKLITTLIIPCLILSNFRTVELTPEYLSIFAVSCLFGMFLSALVYVLLPGKTRSQKGMAVLNFAGINVGFIGIPLITAVLGEKAVFYIAFYSVLVGVLQWTWGVYTITGDKQHVSPRKILTNPATIAMGLALLAFLPGWGARLPGVLTRPVSMMAAVNTPLAMVVMGCYLAGADLRSVFSDRFNWWASFVRLVLISAATAALFCLVPPAFAEARTAVFIAAITPIGVNTATLAHLFGKDSAKAVAMVCLSTILSVFTMPLMMLLAGWLWGL